MDPSFFKCFTIIQSVLCLVRNHFYVFFFFFQFYFLSTYSNNIILFTFYPEIHLNLHHYHHYHPHHHHHHQHRPHYQHCHFAKLFQYLLVDAIKKIEQIKTFLGYFNIHYQCLSFFSNLSSSLLFPWPSLDVPSNPCQSVPGSV